MSTRNAPEIVLGVTGSIAAYKAAELVRLMIKAGWGVTVVMTKGATRFVGALTFQTLSRRPVTVDMFDDPEEWVPGHISMADRASVMVVAPCTANVIAKLAHGLADDALTCMALALNPKAKILIAPAMNGKMWLHPATQENVATLKARGAEFIGPDKGMLSCGYEGIGRLWPVEAIVDRALSLLR